MPVRTLRLSALPLATVLLLCILGPAAGHAGHGFFSPAPGSAGSGPVIEVAADGTVWALSGGALHTMGDEGRSWRLRQPSAGGFDLWLDPADASTLVTTTSSFNLVSLSVSRDRGQSFERRQQFPRRQLRDFTPTSGPWFAMFRDDFGAFAYRSLDRGVSWQPLSETILVGAIDAGPGGDPFVMAGSGGIYTLSSDGNLVQSSFSGNQGIRHVYVSPVDPRRVVLLSTNGAVSWSQDRGRSFSQSALPYDGNFFSFEIFFPPQNPSVVLVSGLTSGENGTRLFRSTDGGATWAQVHILPDNPMLVGPLPSAMVADPCNGRVIYAVSRDLSGLLRSPDLGATWQELSPTPPAGLTPDPELFRLNSLTPVREGCRLIAASNLGAVTSTDRGETWQSMRGLRSGFVREVAFGQKLAGRAYAGGEGLARSEDGGRSFAPVANEISGRPVLRLLPHPDGRLLAVTRDLSERYGRLWRSEDGGDSFVELTGVNFWSGSTLASDSADPSHLIGTAPDGVFESFDFGSSWSLISQSDLAPSENLAIDPLDASRLWGVDGFFMVRSEDGGQTWQSLSWDRADAFVRLHPATGELWTGIGNVIYRSADQGQTWTLAAMSEQFTEVTDLIFDRRDPSTLYYTYFNRSGEATVYRSTDDAASWHPWSLGYAPEIATSLAQDPFDAERWLLGGPEGVHWRVERSLPACPSYTDAGLCLRGERFEVTADWTDFTGRSGRAQLVPFQTGESGLFTFFSPDNWEIMVKVLDGCGFNGHFWVFSAGTTNVDFTVRVTDRFTGRYRQYFNFLGENAPAVTDTAAFACAELVPGGSSDRSTASAPKQPPSASLLWPSSPPLDAEALSKVECGDGEPALCLGEGGRFRVAVRWLDFAGGSGAGQPVPFSTEESGLFTFFSPSNWEMMVKVLDGCGFNGRYWIFAAAVTNVEFVLEVTDQLTGETRSYRNPLGRSADAIIDTAAFAGCG